MSDSDIAVVIPAHNAARWIGRALTSVFQQTYKPAEIIVVDDGSSDDTAALAGEFSEVKVISQPNQERGAARNTGIRSAHAPWVALLDADDEWLPEHLDYARRTLSVDDVDVTCGAYQVVDHSGQALWITRPWSEAEFKDPMRVFERVQFGGLCASNVVVRRVIFNSYRFNETRQMAGAEDWHWFAQLCGVVSIKPFEQCSARYHLHGSNSVLQADRMATAMRLALDELLAMPRFRGRGRLPRRQIECRSAAELVAAGEHRRALVTLLVLARHDPSSVITNQWWRLFARALNTVTNTTGGPIPGDG